MIGIILWRNKKTASRKDGFSNNIKVRVEHVHRTFENSFLYPVFRERFLGISAQRAAG